MYVINSFAKIQQIANIPNYKIIFRITKIHQHNLRKSKQGKPPLFYRESVVSFGRNQPQKMMLQKRDVHGA